MTDPRFDLARALAEAAQAIHAPGTLEDTLSAIAQTARDAVPGFDHVGISVVQGDGTVTTMAATSRLVRELDTLQYKLGEGPCVATLRDQHMIVAEELQDDTRWPRYVPRATARPALGGAGSAGSRRPPSGRPRRRFRMGLPVQQGRTRVLRTFRLDFSRGAGPLRSAASMPKTGSA